MLFFCIDKNCACQENFLVKVDQTVEWQDISGGVGEIPFKRELERLFRVLPIIKDS